MSHTKGETVTRTSPSSAGLLARGSAQVAFSSRVALGSQVAFGWRVALLAGLLLLSPLTGASQRWTAAPTCTVALQFDDLFLCDRELVASLRRRCDSRAGWSRRLSTLRYGDHWSSGSCAPVGRMAEERLEQLRVVIDLNVADAADLRSLPGIGPKLAQRILTAREAARGSELGFDHDAVDAVAGIGPKTLERIAPRVCFDCGWVFASAEPSRRQKR